MDSIENIGDLKQNTGNLKNDSIPDSPQLSQLSYPEKHPIQKKESQKKHGGAEKSGESGVMYYEWNKSMTENAKQIIESDDKCKGEAEV